MMYLANESLEPNCRGVGPLAADHRFGRRFYAPASAFAAVAQVKRWAGRKQVVR